MLDPFMKKEMTRQEFILTLGLATASIFGVGRIIELVTGHSLSKNISTQSITNNTSSAYAGKKVQPRSKA